MKILNFLKNKFTSNELAETIALSLIFYIVLVCFALCIGLALTTFCETDKKEIPSVVSNMFVWSATLIAPIIAILLLNSWRYQKNFEADSTLLNSCEENLIRFKNKIYPICQAVIKIHEVGSQDHTYYLAHSLFRRPLKISDECLNDFYLHMERYLNYNEDTELKKLFNEYYGIANDFLYINKQIISDCYSLIYYQLKEQPLGNGWVDSNFTIIFPEGSPQKRQIESQYSNFNYHYDNTGINMEMDKESGEMISVRKTYKEYYDLMDSYYKQLSAKISEINRA
ncbi:hypothetical protein [Acinetobacter baumannii]|uniref:hypothetical protein n=1 Tax=Acinetobacter baumannii TaxID=470 RepID=UPI000D3C7621|nr:hypothetical protein [Acinetobacter baumannii]PUU96138.1 hypothetical protein DCD75_16440 [Acinetobacter baumannii]